MDEQEMIRFLRSELYQAMERDPELRAALQHIDAGKGTFQDTAQYSERTSELLGQILSRHVDELPEGMRETVCKALLRERYEEVNGICAEVQEQLDAQNGIRLQPQRAPYPAERVQQVAHALEDPTVALSVIQRRAKAPVANVSKSFHDDYMKKNADVRSRLGFKCYLNRVAATGCCKWCTDVAGRYVYGNHPDDIFRRHDNCACTVTFENGRERQDVWSKRIWQEDPAEVEARANRVTTYSTEQAAAIEQSVLDGLTKPGQGDILRVADSGEIGIKITNEAIKAIPELHIFRDKQLDALLHDHAAVLLAEAQKHEIGTEVARILPLDFNLPIPDFIIGEEGGFTVDIPKCSNPSMILHNHPSGGTFSGADIDRFVTDANAKVMCVVGNNGSLYVLEKTDQFDWISFQRHAFDIAGSDDYADTILKGAESYGFKYFTS